MGLITKNIKQMILVKEYWGALFDYILKVIKAFVIFTVRNINFWIHTFVLTDVLFLVF